MSKSYGAVRISVVTPTHNRPDSLLRLLHALRDGTFPAANFEVVIVADGCSDDTVARVRAEPLPYRICVLEQNPGRGAAAARNLGAGHAAGELVVFLDDDIEPSRVLLAEHWREYRDATSATVVIGPPLPVRGATAGLHDIAAWGWWERQFELMRRPGHRFTYENVFSGNLSVPRSMFAHVGGFDVEFNSCRDDSEFGLRAMRHGAHIAFAPTAKAWHHELRDAAALKHRKQAEGVADVRLARLYPDLWPSLRISHPEQRAWTALGIVRRLALDRPWLGEVLAGAAQHVLTLLEWFRLRGIWRSLHAGLMYFWYWHGAARAVGGREGLAPLCVDCLTQIGKPSERQGAGLRIDLAHGLEAAAQALDAARPSSVAIVWGPHYVGSIYDEAGAEPLGGRHLRAALSGDLAQSFKNVLATVLVTGHIRVSRQANGGDAASTFLRTIPWLPSAAMSVPNERALSGDGAWELPIRLLDIEIGAGVDAVADCGNFGVSRALIRRDAVPLGWVTLGRSSGTITAGELLVAVRYQLHAEVRRTAAAEAMQIFAMNARLGHLPPISVIICTRDRPDRLARCLVAMSKVVYPSYEVVVVDNASVSDETRHVAETFGARYVREERPGLDSARNRGMASARHDIIAYTDDDVEVDPHWLRGIAAGFADPTVQFVTGFVAPARIDTAAELLFELAYDGMGKGTRPRRWDPARMSSRELLGTHHIGIGANMAFRRSLLQSLGGFDPALDVGTAARGGGDLNIFHRALMHGAVARYEPSALVRHHHRRDMAALQSQHYDNGRSFGVYLIGIFRRGEIPRAATLWYALRIWLSWLVRRLINRMLSRDPLPVNLIAAELRGALHAPWAYFATKRQARQRDRAASAIDSSADRSNTVSAA